MPPGVPRTHSAATPFLVPTPSRPATDRQKATTMMSDSFPSVFLPGRRPLDRRRLFRGGAVAGAAGLAILAAGGRAGMRAALARQATPPAGGGEANPYFADEVAVLNFALTLEHLDATLSRQGLDQFDDQAFVAAGYDPSVRDYLELVAANEAAQVAFLTETIASRGGSPVGPAAYAFPYSTVVEWLVLSQQVEEVGLDAYTGAAQYLIGNDDLLTAALTIHGVEARHLSYFRLLNGVVPFPDATEEPLTPPEVVALASPLVVGGIATPTAG